MKKYYYITILALLVVTLLQGYNVSLQYKEYTYKEIDKINSALKVSVDKNMLSERIKFTIHIKMGNNEFITNKCQKKTFSRQSQRKKMSFALTK